MFEERVTFESLTIMHHQLPEEGFQPKPNSCQQVHLDVNFRLPSFHIPCLCFKTARNSGTKVAVIYGVYFLSIRLGRTLQLGHSQ